MSESKSCNLKYYQTSFWIKQNLTSSCCKSQTETLDRNQPLQHYLDKWRHEFDLLDQGVKIDNCKLCWKHEESGQVSHRMESGQGIPQVNLILSLSNLCNQMCSYCSPKFSSEWENSIRTKGNFINISQTAKENLALDPEHSHDDHWIQQISDYINTRPDNSVKLSLIGGEPLMHFPSLKKIDLLNKDKIKTFQLTTNLNPPSNKFLVWILENFSKEKLTFDISLDSSLEFMPEVRSGFDAKKFTENLQLLMDQDIQDLSFKCVISAMSIFDLDKFLPYLQEHQQIQPHFRQINNPDCLDPIYVPKKFRDSILQKCSHLQVPEIFKKILSYDHDDDNLKLFEQHSYLQQYFERTNIDPTMSQNPLFAEYWSWLTKNYKR